MVEGGPGGFDPEVDPKQPEPVEDAQTARRPELTLLGQEVMVRRGSGEIESGWRVSLHSAGRDSVLVEKLDPESAEGGSMTKLISLSELAPLNPVPLGIEVSVIRSSGEADPGWKVTSIAEDESGQIVVVSKLDPENPGHTLQKKVPLLKLLETNPGLRESPKKESKPEPPAVSYQRGQMEFNGHRWEGIVIGGRILIYKETHPDGVYFGVNDQATSIHYGSFRSQSAAGRAGKRIAQIEGIDLYDPLVWFSGNKGASPDSDKISTEIKRILDEEAATDSPIPESPLPDNPPLGHPIDAGAEVESTPPPNDPIPPQAGPAPERTTSDYEQRDLVLRNADNYLYGVDKDRIMAGREKAKGATKVIRRIYEVMSRTRTTAGESEQIRNLDRIRGAAYKEDEWKKVLRPNENRPKTKKFLQEKLVKLGLKKPEDIRAYELTVGEKQRIEELARYREAIKYRDDAVKLIKEKRDATDLTPERDAEIDRQLDHYYAYLMKLAHEDSHKVIYEGESKTYRKLDSKHGPRQPNESESDYRNRIAPENTDQRLKDVRLYIPGQPRPEPLANEATEPTKKPPALAPENQRYDQWLKDRQEGEQSGKYFTRLEGMVKETFGELGNPDAIRGITEIYRLLQDFSRTGINLKDYDIEIDEKPSTKSYKQPGTGKKQSQAMLGSPTRTITMKVADEYYIFTLYSDGYIDGNKKIPLPKDSSSQENISLRQCRVSYTTHHPRPALERINPTVEDIRKNDRILIRIDDVLRKLRDEAEAIQNQII
ncbi:MAG: hypothetical protein NUV54_03190 [Candidatus Taylorbacteria bacterium]|nr:hypothetical protein [Candidatus Taylorbacteria bacterium]